MAKIKHQLVLSTTDPNNEIGSLKVRQEDINTQVLSVEIIENGNLKNFDGFIPFLVNKTKLDEGKPLEEKVSQYSPSEARLEHTLTLRDRQWVGKNIAYFSFRVLSEDGTYTESFSTSDFEYQVVTGVFKGTVYDSAYVWTFEELLRRFKNNLTLTQDQMDQLKLEWKKFWKDNQELLGELSESGDLSPIINELLSSRGEYPSLADRLDNKTITDVSGDIGGYKPRAEFQEALNDLYSNIDTTKFVIGHLTDLHTTSDTPNTYSYSKYSITHMTNFQFLKDKLDCIVYGGDNVDGVIPDKINLIENTRKFALKAFSGESSDIPTFGLIGNHDSGTAAYTQKLKQAAMPANTLSENELKGFYRTNEKIYGEIRNGDSLYFYKDFTEYKIRVVGLYSNDVNHSALNQDGSFKYPDIDNYGYQQGQLDWLANTALKNVPNDYHTLFVSHVPIMLSDTTSRKNEDKLVDIISAFQTGATISVNSTVIDHPVNVTADFNDQGPRIVIGLFCGHWHDEGISEVRGFKQIRNTCSVLMGTEYVNSAKEDAFTILEIDTTKKHVNIRGFGRATNREFDY